MFFDLVATVLAGVAVAGIVLFLRRILRLPLPAWLVPAAAGAAMLGYTIWSEYSWFQRDLAARPQTLSVVWQNEEKAFWRPWTYLAPITDQYRALDMTSLITPESAPHLRVGGLFLVKRRQQAIIVRSAFDCTKSEWTSAMDGAKFADDGAVEAGTWRSIAPEDPLIVAACDGD